MQITLNENLDCKWGDSTTTPRKEYDLIRENGTLSSKNIEDTVRPLSNDEFIFKNGKCISIWFSNV